MLIVSSIQNIKRITKPITCPICKSKSAIYYLIANNFHGRQEINKSEQFKLYRCLSCQVIFLNGLVIDQRFYSKYYKQDYYLPSFRKKNLSSLEILFGQFVNFQKINKIKNLFPKLNKIKLLDFGSGKGEFIKALNFRKFEPYGVEINRQAERYCLNKGIKMLTLNKTNLTKYKKYFDVITLWHVVEHLSQPSLYLKKLKTLLKKGGFIILTTPNSNSLGARLGKENWFHLDSPRHLFLFNKYSLNCLLESLGYKTLQVYSLFYECPLDLLWSVRKLTYIKYFIYIFYPLLKLFSQETIVYIAQK